MSGSLRACTSKDITPVERSTRLKSVCHLASNAAHHLDEPTTMAALWKAYKALAADETETDISLRIKHQAMMLAVLAPWQWLESTIVTRCKDILTHPDFCRSDWLFPLVTSASQMVELRLSKRVFDPRMCGELPADTFLYHNHRRLPLQWESQDEQCDTVVAIVCDVLRVWLQFPDDNSRYQAWFVRSIVDCWGDAALYLHATWDLFRVVTRGSLVKSTRRVLRPNHMDPFVDLLLDHPLSVKRHLSSESKTLRYIASTLTAVGESVMHSPHPQDASITLPPQLADVASNRVQQFIRFMGQACDVLLNKVDSHSASIVQRAILSDPDRYFPFREHAPSRLNVLQDNGPFSPQLMQTCTGIFSSAVFRGITFGTDFSRSGPVTFDSLDDWNSATEGLSVEKYCCRSAYGQCNPGRVPALAESYWTTATKGEWEALFQSTPQVPFLNGYDFLLSNRFPQLGPLGAYLLAADYAYAGAFAWPSSDDISAVIRSINKGAASGLQRLGFVTRTKTKKPGIDGTRKGVDLAREWISGEVILREGDPAIVNDIVVEHSLCKLMRAIKDCLIEE